MKLNYISARGDVLPLAANKYFVLSHVDGHTTAGTSITSAVVGGVDGDTVTNVQATPRAIIIDLRIRGDVDVEEAKRAILRVVKLKKSGSLVWEQNNRTVTITGIVEAVEMPRWTDEVIMQITFYCAQPFWEDVDTIVQQINEAIGLHYFTNSPADMLYFPESGIPFGEYDAIREKAFFNNGDVSVGVEITLFAHDTVTNPIIYDGNGNFFGLGYEYESADGGAGIGTAIISNPFVMQAGDNVIITTHKGNKTVKHNGVNILDKVKPNSTWLQLDTGDNVFRISSNDENIANMSFAITYKQRYI